MKIILKEEVINLGAIGEIVQVADGYGRNFLIPKGLAIKATAGNLRQFEAEKATWLKKALAMKKSAEGVKDVIEAVTLEFEMKAGEEGKLFGSVTSKDIVQAFSEKGVEVDKRKIVIGESLRSLGEHTIGIKLHSEVLANVKVTITREGGDIVPEELPEEDNPDQEVSEGEDVAGDEVASEEESSESDKSEEEK
ncbi:MAG: 50S ribosomal protein L9 [Deltaproteobacteria bacterium]|nr:50S ribosomal protein L9 [Deltaproteobacteria bacterium]